MTPSSKRAIIDVTDLLMKGFKVMKQEGVDMLEVLFRGPQYSPYEDGFWIVRVDIPSEYPFEPPRLFFSNPIYHPNIDFVSGVVFFNAVFDEWNPIFDLVRLFEIFLPNLLLYPTHRVPINVEAVLLFLWGREEFEEKAREYCEMYAYGDDMLMRSSSDSKEEDVGEEEGSESSQD